MLLICIFTHKYLEMDSHFSQNECPSLVTATRNGHTRMCMVWIE